MVWLVLARALAGIGGGGIVSSVWTITSEIVDVQSRAKWSQALSITWSCSAIAGPLLGGLFSGAPFDPLRFVYRSLISHPKGNPASSAGDGPVSSLRTACRYRSHILSVYLNLPVCVFAFAVLCFSLRPVSMGRAQNVSWRALMQRFDFVGL